MHSLSRKSILISCCFIVILAFAHVFEGKPDSKKFDWTLSHVKKILSDEVYIGSTVYGRQKKISYKSKKIVKTPKSDWKVVPRTHEPIISEDVFFQVQQSIASRHRITNNGSYHIFSGLVRCADCGWVLSFHTNRRESNKPYRYFRCRKTVEKVGVCTSHFIPYDTLYAYVLSRLQYWSSAVQVDPDAILEQLKNASDSDSDATRKRLTSDLKAAEKRIAKLDSMIAKLYEDRLSETLNERTFTMLTQKYQNEQDELAAKIETMTQQFEAMKQQSDGLRNGLSWSSSIQPLLS